jgi:tripartite ATP-independent transporter DctM subunit
MSDLALGICGIGAVLVGLLLLKIPPGFVMAIVGFAGMALTRSPEAAMQMIGSEFWEVFSGYGLTVIPMFILVGELIYYAGYSDRLYRSTYQWFGHRRGGLAITTIFASAGFSAICGSNTATAATMSAVAIPAMSKYRYHPTLMAGAVSAGSTLGVMVPPSIVLVVYGLQTGASIGKLFFGALIPSILLTTFIALTVTAICMRHPTWGPRGERTGWGDRLRAIPAVLDVLVLFLVVMAALLSGVVTATEAAATSCFLALIICLVRRRLTWSAFRSSVQDTLRITCMVFLIVAGAVIFGRFLTQTRLPQELALLISQAQWPQWMTLLAMLLLFAIGGCLMDALAFLLVALPIFTPLVAQMGYDPVWFGVMVCLVTTLGAITPPIGICCFVVAGMSKDIRVEQAFKGSMYYLPAYVVTGALMFFFPEWSVMLLASLAP